MSDKQFYAVIDYEDAYVQPLLLSALRSRLPSELLVLIKDVAELPSHTSRLLQWQQYESIGWDNLVGNSRTSLANSYIIRKALIRKHYLSTTISHWLTKHPQSVLKAHVKPSVEFEVDYAEFLDDALLEAYELRESWERNAAKPAEQREWWILKPGMSDRGQGIRLFSSEEELTAIFEEWEPASDDEEEAELPDTPSLDAALKDKMATIELDDDATDRGVITSQLRHFVAQPYIHPPLLFQPPFESAGRKFHIRTYVLAVGALKVYVYKPTLALFAGKPYNAPSTDSDPNADLTSHLTNTCLQSGEREGSVHAFWSLPGLPNNINWHDDVFRQICEVTGEVFEAAARSMSIHFQPLPNAFEIFGLDFMVDAEGKAWLLEVNAFPDFAQTGGELSGLVQGLFEEVVEVGVKPFFDLPDASGAGKEVGMVNVLDIDLGRR